MSADKRMLVFSFVYLLRLLHGGKDAEFHKQTICWPGHPSCSRSIFHWFRLPDPSHERSDEVENITSETAKPAPSLINGFVYRAELNSSACRLGLMLDFNLVII